MIIALLLVQNHSGTVTAAVQLAAAAMQWPDLQTQIRAVAVCRTVAAAAGAPLNPVGGACGVGSGGTLLQPLLVPCLLQQAVRALASADGPHVASELLLLIRSIYVAGAALQPSPAAQIRELLPNVTAQAIAKVCGLLLEPHRCSAPCSDGSVGGVAYAPVSTPACWLPTRQQSIAVLNVLRDAQALLDAAGWRSCVPVALQRDPLSGPHVQLDSDLDTNKTEKHHKDTFKRFFTAAGFSNLDEPSEIQKKQIRLSNPSEGGPRKVGEASEEIQWPDLYDVVIDPS